MSGNSFIIDCPFCKAKVAATQASKSIRRGEDPEYGEPYAVAIHVGSCIECDRLLVGESFQLDFAGFGCERDRWSDITRVYPKPRKQFSSERIPKLVESSLEEADKALQAGAQIAGCAMLGRALEAMCQDVIATHAAADALIASITGESAAAPSAPRRPVMLNEGIRKLRDLGVIDERLYNWSQDLRAFRNIAAHASTALISRQDAEDLQTFAIAIIEYVYDLADRYEEFKNRVAKQAETSDD